MSIFGIGFQRHQRLAVKRRNPRDVMVYHVVIIKYQSYDVIVSCLVLTNAELKVVVSTMTSSLNTSPMTSSSAA